MRSRGIGKRLPYEEDVYETQARHICNFCEVDITDDRTGAHEKAHIANGEPTNSRVERRQIKVGTRTVPAVAREVWVVDRPAG